MIEFSDAVVLIPTGRYRMRLFYTLLIYLLSPVVLFLLYRPRHGNSGFGPRWKNIWAGRPTKHPTPIWIHAVSVGNHCRHTAVKHSNNSIPNYPIVGLTTTTRTGCRSGGQQADLVGPSSTRHWTIRRW